MKNWKFISLLLMLIVGVTSCSLDDDEEQCITGPVGFNVEFIEAGTGENVYRNNRFQTSELRVTDEDNKIITHRFINEQDKTIIQVNLQFETGEKVISMKLDDETTVNFELTVSTLQENCITYYISEFEVPEYGYDDSGTSGIVRITL